MKMMLPKLKRRRDSEENNSKLVKLPRPSAHNGDTAVKHQHKIPVPSNGDTAVKHQHKIPVPSNYRLASKYVRLAVEEKRNIQPLLAQDKHFRAGRTVVGRVLSNMPIIDAVYRQLELAAKEPKLSRWLALVFISELLFGNGRLNGNSLPVECVRRYAEAIRAAGWGIDKKRKHAGKIKEPRFVRVNTTALSVDEAKRLLAEKGWILVHQKFTAYQSFLERVKTLGVLEYMEDFHFPDMLVFPHGAKTFWAREEKLKDKFLLQNKACLIPTYLLNPPKKSVVLDMCAAPGLKTTHLACLMKNKGRIYAVEKDPARYEVLCQFAGSYGVIKTIQNDCLQVTNEQVPDVEYILVDPSCSGSGMLQRQIVSEPVDAERLYKLAGMQYKLLSHAMNGFPNVRRIVYSTCSVHVEENEEVVQSVLIRNEHFRLLDARTELGKEWRNVGSPAYRNIGERCLYAKTHDDLTIGMFVAVFERCPKGVKNEFYVPEAKKHMRSYKQMIELKKSLKQKKVLAAKNRLKNALKAKESALGKDKSGDEESPPKKRKTNDLKAKKSALGKDKSGDGKSPPKKLNTNVLKAKESALEKDKSGDEESPPKKRKTNVQKVKESALGNDKSGDEKSPPKKRKTNVQKAKEPVPRKDKPGLEKSAFKMRKTNVRKAKGSVPRKDKSAFKEQ